MNPELQKAIGDILTVVKDGAQFAAATARQELPLLVQEYLRWGVTEAIMSTLLWCCTALALWKLSRHILRQPVTRFDPDFTTLKVTTASWVMQQTFGVYVLPVLSGLCALVATGPLFTAIKILIAPRVYLLETLAGLVK